MQDMDRGKTVRTVQSEVPGAPIVMLATYQGNAQISKALKAGARAYIPKERLHREVLDTIRTAHAGQKRIASEIAAEPPEYAASSPLSLREIDVLRLVAAGSSNRRIADHSSLLALLKIKSNGFL